MFKIYTLIFIMMKLAEFIEKPVFQFNGLYNNGGKVQHFRSIHEELNVNTSIMEE